jgi:hypothetical protein
MSNIYIHLFPFFKVIFPTYYKIAKFYLPHNFFLKLNRFIIGFIQYHGKIAESQKIKKVTICLFE